MYKAYQSKVKQFKLMENKILLTPVNIFLDICLQVEIVWQIRQFISLNSIYFQLSIYTWQHTSIQIHGKWIGKQVT